MLLTFLLGLDATAVERFAGLGALWETFVLGELLKWREARHPEATLWFYRDRDGVETDFVVQHGGGLTLLDAKLDELPGAGDARSALATRSRLRDVRRVGLVTPTQQSFPLTSECDVVSGWTLDAWL